MAGRGVVGKEDRERTAISIGRKPGEHDLREVRAGERFNKKEVINSIKRYLKVRLEK